MVSFRKNKHCMAHWHMFLLQSHHTPHSTHQFHQKSPMNLAGSRHERASKSNTSLPTPRRATYSECATRCTYLARDKSAKYQVASRSLHTPSVNNNKRMTKTANRSSHLLPRRGKHFTPLLRMRGCPRTPNMREITRSKCPFI